MISRTGPIRLAFLSWTIFVWGIVRLRNILADPALEGSAVAASVLLSASFWIPAVALLLTIFQSAVRRGPLPGVVGVGLDALAAWTVVVWLYKMVDIAAFGDHAVGFIVVHMVLALASIGLAVAVIRAGRRGLGGTSEMSSNPARNAGTSV